VVTDHTQFPISFVLWLYFYLEPFPRYYHLWINSLRYHKWRRKILPFGRTSKSSSSGDRWN